ncbi:MAG: NAD(P)-binding domain-containing protein [Verrucomicrobiota bacterium]
MKKASMLDWLIVGGGPHGVHMANCLLDRGIALEDLGILDPNAEPLARWNHHTGNAGMSHLRSPEVHNLDIDPLSMGVHATSDGFIAAKREKDGARDEPDFIPPYSRPSLRLFKHQVRSIVERTGLMSRWKLGRACSIESIEGGYQIQTEIGEQIEAVNIVLALGIGDQPNWPDWARQCKGRENQVGVYHIFSPEFRRGDIGEDHDVVIVGAGISAAQLAMSLLEMNPSRHVAMVSRHYLRKEDFDSDPGWLGPTLLKRFEAENDYGERRAMIQEARNRGSLAAEVMHTLQDAIRDGAIRWELAEIEGVSQKADEGGLHLQIRQYELDEEEYLKTGEIVSKLSDETQSLEADTVVLATGFESKRPGGGFVDDAIKTMSLPTADDGFPVVDRHLRWRQGLFVMGPLAELEVGPASRNISGARMAAERIISSLEASPDGLELRRVDPDASMLQEDERRDLGRYPGSLIAIS